MKLKKALVIFVLVAIISVCFAGCIEEPPSAPTVTPTPKTELSLGESVIVDGISFTVVGFEESYDYESAWYGTNETVYPKEGAKFLWIYVRAENVGELAKKTPGESSVVILYKNEVIYPKVYWTTDRKIIDRKMYDGYKEIYPNIVEEGWALFEVPEGIDISQAKIRVELDTRIVRWSLAS